MSHSQQQLIARLACLDSNLVSDVMDAGGLRGQVLHHTLRPINARSRLVGVAVCVRGEPASARSGRASLTAFAIDESLFPGCIVVIGSGGSPGCSVVGGLMARSWQAAGCNGLLTDGLVRDAQELGEIGFAAFALGTSPANSGGRWNVVEVGGTVEFSGCDGSATAIVGGDLIIADADGCTVVAGRHAEAIITAAERLKEIETQIVLMMTSGASRKEAFAANPRFDHVPRFV